MSVKICQNTSLCLIDNISALLGLHLCLTNGEGCLIGGGFDLKGFYRGEGK